MIWRIEKPTPSGWYRFRTSEHDHVQARVFEFGGHHMDAVWADGRSEYVIEMPGYWAGPLEG